MTRTPRTVVDPGWPLKEGIAVVALSNLNQPCGSRLVVVPAAFKLWKIWRTVCPADPDRTCA